MNYLTLFTWGYWGCGSATDHLIRAVDAVETARGYQPPLFVDIRFSRSVRAPGFNGRAFELAVGETRYQWLNALGNVGIRDGSPMRIKDPAAADTLFEIARRCAHNRQRVLFFCACELPGVEGNGCHRTTVARLVLEAARRYEVPTQVVEWPGGDPNLDAVEIHISKSAFQKIARGASAIPLEEPVQLATMAGLPWRSLVHLRHNGPDGESRILVSGPARYKKGGWYLPIFGSIGDDVSREEVHRKIMDQRREDGFEARLSQESGEGN
jgi:hypothetical protein